MDFIYSLVNGYTGTGRVAVWPPVVVILLTGTRVHLRACNTIQRDVIMFSISVCKCVMYFWKYPNVKKKQIISRPVRHIFRPAAQCTNIRGDVWIPTDPIQQRKRPPGWEIIYYYYSIRSACIYAVFDHFPTLFLSNCSSNGWYL